MDARDGSRLAAELERRSMVAGVALNLAGAGLLGVYMLVVFPPEGDSFFLSRERGLAAVVVYNAICSLTAIRRSRPKFTQMRGWMEEGRAPSQQERAGVLSLPALFARMTLVRWALAVPLFALPSLDVSAGFAFEVATFILLASLTTTAGSYLISERILRPAFALALGDAPPPEARSLGIGPRLLLTWLLCSGVPILLVAFIPIARDVREADDLIAPIWFAAAAALGAGFIATRLATQAVTKPVRDLRRAVDAVGRGEFEASVPVDDGSEIGRLQAGFNAMVAGLREREHLRDLYGRQVGTDVAREALERGWALGGQTREISALFVDVVGSTALAQREPPQRVVALLNEFFAAVVLVVDEHGGQVNKFEGDAALCVFGAPVAQPDHAARVLATARDLRARLGTLGGEIDAAIGVASGTAVAGYVGAETRFEYTVLGDPVNVAARLTELAKRHPGRLLASAETVECAGAPEAERWSSDGEVVLRGRASPTRLAVPMPRPVLTTA